METSDLDTNKGTPSSSKCKHQVTRSDSPRPSCVSMKSDISIDNPPNFKDGHSISVYSVQQKSGDKSKKIIIRDTGPDAESDVNEFHKKFKLNLLKKYQDLNEAILNQENRTLLTEIYTELYITEGDSGDVNKEHEVRQIEAASRRTIEETPIKINEILKNSSDQDKTIRTVLTKGVAGIGKTVSVHKFILDWAEGKENQDVPLIFPLPFRQLNLMKDQKVSLMELLRVCFNQKKETERFSFEKVLFIFDGLDECRFSLDFQNTIRVCDVTESASVPVLLINLIKGNLLPSALIWITSRPAAADQIPSECVDLITQVRGFNDPQKEEYFRKRISDQSLANNIITHLKSLRSLYIMCHIPIFCWISATVLERMLGEAESGEIPKTLTQMYTHFLIIQINIKREKYSENGEEMLLKLGRLAFQQLEKHNLIFYDEDLRECGIDVREAAVYSGVCTQIFREGIELHPSKVYCFVHLSVQEHLAAVYVHLKYKREKRNVLVQTQSSDLKEITISDVHKTAIDQALQSETGHLDIFLRFLLGLSLEPNQDLLHSFVTQMKCNLESKEETVQYIKNQISRDPPTEKSINLFHCLNELGDDSLVEEIQQYLKSGKQSELTSSQWSALLFVLLTSAHELENFDLSKYTTPDNISDWVLLKMMPVIAESRKAIINCHTMKWRSWTALDSVISSNSDSKTSNLRELHLSVGTIDLSQNNLGDSGVKHLSAVLEDPHCKVEALRLFNCGVSGEGCAALASALKCNPSHLKELHLSNNILGDSGVKHLCGFLENSHCNLEIFGLCYCDISDEGCAALTSALRLNPSHLRQLDLSGNKLGDKGLKHFSDILKDPHCKLEKLRMCECAISVEGCAALALALGSNPSYLRELNLSKNPIGDSGVKHLSAVLENPHCIVEILRLFQCDLSGEGCAALASALISNPSHLKELHLSENNLGDSGVKHLSALLENPHCNLEALRLCKSGVTDEGCAALASALISNPSHLRELELVQNKIDVPGRNLLSALQKDDGYQLQDLSL
ncbi:NACHT, LRR and PYD domains-containing protein 3-like isoform 4-T4 [Clarias gariepinus]|nr:NACHT, LRR and PYD domains-containing protein 12-like isoform X2 [Clarias gariepinus]